MKPVEPSNQLGGRQRCLDGQAIKIKGENLVEMKSHNLDMSKASFEVAAIYPGKYLGHYKEVE